MAPVLVLSDQAKKYVVKVDVSVFDIGAVLSLMSVVDEKLHPCAFSLTKIVSCREELQCG